MRAAFSVSTVSGFILFGVSMRAACSLYVRFVVPLGRGSGSTRAAGLLRTSIRVHLMDTSNGEDEGGACLVFPALQRASHALFSFEIPIFVL